MKQRPQRGVATSSPQPARPHIRKTSTSPQKAIDTKYIRLAFAVIAAGVAFVCWAIWSLDAGQAIHDVWKHRMGLARTVWSGLFSSMQLDDKNIDVHSLLACKGEQEDFDRLVRALSASGASVSAVNISYNVHGVRGLVATTAVPKGQALLSVPLELSLSAATYSARKHTPSATHSWRRHKDGDQFLDPLALLHEVLGRRTHSHWAAYLCTLPRGTPDHGLPVGFRDAWSRRVLRALPEMWRLVQKRESAVDTFTALSREALRGMPGAGVGRPWWLLRLGFFERMYMWAYSAAKTRTLILDLDEADQAGAGLLMHSAAKQGAKQHAPASKVLPILPPQLRVWMSELGVMVPVLDMANHASLDTASTVMAIRFGRHVSVQQPGSDPSTRTARELGGPGVHFSLVASRDIGPGEEITFSYNPDDDEEPLCNFRWLVEYGFIIQDGKPERDCYAWNITAADVDALLESMTGRSLEPQERAGAQLHQHRVQAWSTASLSAAGKVDGQLVQWLEAAAHGVRDEVAGGRGLQREDEEGVAHALGLKMLCALVSQQQQKVQREVQSLEAERGSSQASPYTQQVLSQLLRGGVRALATGHEVLAPFC